MGFPTPSRIDLNGRLFAGELGLRQTKDQDEYEEKKYRVLPGSLLLLSCGIVDYLSAPGNLPFSYLLGLGVMCNITIAHITRRCIQCYMDHIIRCQTLDPNEVTES